MNSIKKAIQYLKDTTAEERYETFTVNATEAFPPLEIAFKGLEAIDRLSRKAVSAAKSQHEEWIEDGTYTEVRRGIASDLRTLGSWADQGLAWLADKVDVDPESMIIADIESFDNPPVRIIEEKTREDLTIVSEEETPDIEEDVIGRTFLENWASNVHIPNVQDMSLEELREVYENRESLSSLGGALNEGDFNNNLFEDFSEGGLIASQFEYGSYGMSPFGGFTN